METKLHWSNKMIIDGNKFKEIEIKKVVNMKVNIYFLIFLFSASLKENKKQQQSLPWKLGLVTYKDIRCVAIIVEKKREWRQGKVSISL